MAAFDVTCNAVYVSVVAVVVAMEGEEEQEKREKGRNRSWLRRRGKRGEFASFSFFFLTSFTTCSFGRCHHVVFCLARNHGNERALVAR